MAKESKNFRQSGRWRFVTVLTLTTCAVIAVVLGLGTLVGGNFGVPQKMTLEMVGSLQRSATVTLGSVEEIYEDYLSFVSVRAENKRLQADVDKYLLELEKYREGYNSYLSLQEQLKFKQSLSFKSFAARVVGKGGLGTYQTIVIDLGRSSDIIAGMIAFAPAGVVGQVIQVSDSYAKVLLANAPSSAIDAMVQKSRVRGILKGNGSAGYTLEYVLKNADIAVGDDVVTAGVGGMFPTGMTLGKVSAVEKKRLGMFLQVEIEPSVDFQSLEYVFVDPSDRREINELLNSSGKR
ncbi:rod shape-determining protein MreC [Desulfotalea psychrophila]|uniref:Cell shape-determining protein MreC n=1 Tax=Desulfotalea psychrophila (strain LSv54 / DSM 12343) TaxID=177439 RepID=Q6APB4_DESPS|nr:rod shape-determining protein MreC [Desulfotalea psychrophila]CAG35810.1 related to rod shape-determining protein (MreC) [Desulfotalea psychrophila LSv54]